MSPVVYVHALPSAWPEDALDLLYLRNSEHHELLSEVGDADKLLQELNKLQEPVNLVVIDAYEEVVRVWKLYPQVFRERVLRLFLVGGHLTPHVPTDPRLIQNHPERFPPNADPRIADPEAFSALLTSGEAVIWLPRDLCLWRVDVMGLTDAPVLLSALPALCLARQPDPLPWLRLFRTIPARVEADKKGKVAAFETKTANPNLHVVVGIDGAALTRELIRVVSPLPA